MKMLKKLIALFAVSAMAASPLNAAQCDAGGCAYEESRCCPSVAPCVALGAIALIAIIAVAIQNSNNHHSGHGH